MKRFNKNSLLFVFVIVFIVAGLFSFDGNIRPILGSVKFALTGKYTIEEAKHTIELATIDDLRYHDLLMNINSAKENVEGARVVKKDEDTIVVKDDDGYLGNPTNSIISDKDIEIVGEKIKDLSNVVEENGAKILYCAAPAKEYYCSFPSNTPNNKKASMDKLIACLNTKQIPYLNLEGVLDKENSKESFFRTDHHWKPDAGFRATKAICEELNSKYGFEYNNKYTNIDNYNTENYPNWFLGSQGKKIGPYFTWQGVDDFELITPKFDTNLTEEQPFKNSVRSGKFEDVALYLDNLKKDYYIQNTYATYGGGDFRLQIVKNNMNKSGKKILVIRDSFACVVTPFLSLQAGELHVCDVRDMDGMVGDKMNMESYIKAIKPDFVVVLYTHVDDRSDSRYDFF